MYDFQMLKILPYQSYLDKSIKIVNQVKFPLIYEESFLGVHLFRFIL